jgi:ATP-binding cassette subfamily B protein
MMAIYATCSLSVGLAGSFLGSAAALYAAMNTRNGMFGKIQTYSFCEVDKLSTASLITRLSNDVQKHQINLQMILTMLFRAPVTIVISLISAFTPPMGNTTYGCITIGIVVVMLLVVGIIGSRVIPIFSKAQKKLDGTNAIMRENILGARVVKAFNIQNNQHERYETENKELKRLNIRGQALMLPIMSIITFILNAGIVIILIVAGAQFVHSDSHPSINAGIFAFTQLIIIVLFSAMIAVMVIVNSTRTMASIKRINEVLDTNSSIVDSKTPVTIPNNYSLKFEHVNFKYSTTSESNVLDDVNFEVESGTTLGIIGGTGSGKSTIASLIPRFYDVTSGSITIGGVNIKDASTNQLNGIVGVVLQESVLFAGTIASNLKFGKQDATKEEMIEACTNACA